MKNPLKQHICHEQPAVIFIERIGDGPWSIHCVDHPREDNEPLQSNRCPYCNKILDKEK